MDEAMVFNVVLYDKYFNIPLRGLLQAGDCSFAFEASILDDDPPEAAGRRGIYCEVRLFEHDDTLRQVLEEKDTIFWRWRAEFDSGRLDKDTHPLYVNARYKLLSAQADAMFPGLGTPVAVARGLMRIESDKFVFDRLNYTETGR